MFQMTPPPFFLAAEHQSPAAAPGAGGRTGRGEHRLLQLLVPFRARAPGWPLLLPRRLGCLLLKCRYHFFQLLLLLYRWLEPALPPLQLLRAAVSASDGQQVQLLRQV